MRSLTKNEVETLIKFCDDGLEAAVEDVESATSEEEIAYAKGKRTGFEMAKERILEFINSKA